MNAHLNTGRPVSEPPVNPLDPEDWRLVHLGSCGKQLVVNHGIVLPTSLSKTMSEANLPTDQHAMRALTIPSWPVAAPTSGATLSY